MDSKALHQMTYGLFLLTAREDGKDNGCIINTAVQVANEPTRISISVIRGNKTCDMILHTGVFNISALSEDAEFALFSGLVCSPAGTRTNLRGLRMWLAAKTACTT